MVVLTCSHEVMPSILENSTHCGQEALKQKKLTEREERIKRIEEKRQAALKAKADKRKLLQEKREALKKAKTGKTSS